MKELIQRIVLFILHHRLVPLCVHYYLLTELPFGLSPMVKIELTLEQRQGAIDYVKSHGALLREAQDANKRN